MLRGQQHRLVAGDRRHRREDVHALGAGDARHQLQGEQRDALCRHRLDLFGRGERLERGNQGLALAHERHVLATALGIGPVAANLEDDIRGLEDLRAASQNLGSLLGEGFIRKAGGLSGTALQDHLDSRLG